MWLSLMVVGEPACLPERHAFPISHLFLSTPFSVKFIRPVKVNKFLNVKLGRDAAFTHLSPVTAAQKQHRSSRSPG